MSVSESIVDGTTIGIVEFPPDAKKLATILTWLWNEGAFRHFSLTEETLEKAKKLGIKITKIDK